MRTQFQLSAFIFINVAQIFAGHIHSVITRNKIAAEKIIEIFLNQYFFAFAKQIRSCTRKYKRRL